MLKIFFIAQLKPDRTVDFPTSCNTIKKTLPSVVMTLYQNIELAIKTVAKEIVKLIAAFLIFLDRRYVSGLTSTKNYNKKTVLHMKSKSTGGINNLAANNLQHGQTQYIPQNSSIKCNKKQFSHTPTKTMHLPIVERAIHNANYNGAKLPDSCKISESKHITEPKSIADLDTILNASYRPVYNKSMSLPLYSHTNMHQTDIVKKIFAKNQATQDKVVVIKQSTPSTLHITEKITPSKKITKLAENTQYTSTDSTQTELYIPSTAQGATNRCSSESTIPIGLIKAIKTQTIGTELLLQEYLGQLKSKIIKPGMAVQCILEKLNEKYKITPQNDRFDQELLLSVLLYAAATKNSAAYNNMNLDISVLPDNWRQSVRLCLEHGTESALWNKYELEIFTTINHHADSIESEQDIVTESIKQNSIHTACSSTPNATTSLPKTEIRKKLQNDYLELEGIIESYCKQLKTSAIKPGKALGYTLETLRQKENMTLGDEKFCSENLFLALLHAAVYNTANTTNDINTLLQKLMCYMGRAGHKIDIDTATKLLSKSVTCLEECNSLPNQYLYTGSWNETERLILSKTFNIARAAQILTESTTLLQYTDKHEANALTTMNAKYVIRWLLNLLRQSKIPITHAKRQYTEHTESSTKDTEGCNKVTKYNSLIIFPKSVAKLLEEYRYNLETSAIQQHGRAMQAVLDYFDQSSLEKLTQDNQKNQFLLSSLIYAKSIVDPFQGSKSFDSATPMWNTQEWQILSNVAYFLLCNNLPDSINDVLKNCSKNTISTLTQNIQQLEKIATEQNTTANPYATLVFITSPLLMNAHSPDYENIVNPTTKTINKNRYYNAVEERLLPALVMINEIAKKQGKKAWVCVPEINADYSAGKFSGPICNIFYNALKNLLEKHVDRLTAVEFVCIKLGMYQNENKKCPDAYKKSHQASMRVPIKINMQHATEGELLNLIVLPCTHAECKNPNLPAEEDAQGHHVKCSFDPSRHLPFIFVANAKLPLPGTKEFTTLTGYSCQDELTSRLLIPAAHILNSQATENIEAMYLNLKYTTNKQTVCPEVKTFSHPSTNMLNIETQPTLPAQIQSLMI